MATMMACVAVRKIGSGGVVLITSAIAATAMRRVVTAQSMATVTSIVRLTAKALAVVTKKATAETIVVIFGSSGLSKSG